MIDDHPEIQGQNPTSRKLVLPAYPQEPHFPDTYTQEVGTSPRSFTSRNTSLAPQNPFTKLKYLWRSDPAYKVLMVSIATVLVASLVFVTIGGIVFAQASFGNTNTLARTNPQSPTDMHPTFPTPSGGQGSTSSSQPPQNPTPILQDNPPITLPTDPTLTIGGGQPTLEITTIPQQVHNNTTVQVGVTANMADMSVHLQVIYNALPGTFISGTVMTDGNANATLTWNVHVMTLTTTTRNITAHVVAVGQGPDGQQVSSQPVTVQIVIK